MLSSDTLTNENTIITDEHEVSLSQYVSGVANSKKIRKNAEKRLLSFLHTFRCSKNEDVEKFLTMSDKCISFEKRNRSRTYLILNEENHILGYFSLALKTLFVQHNSITSAMKRRINPGKSVSSIAPDTEYYNVYLIGQIGRNDSFTSNDLSLKDVLREIYSILYEVQNRVGGSSILVEVDTNEKLIGLYKKYGFQYLDADQESLSQLLILFDAI